MNRRAALLALCVSLAGIIAPAYAQSDGVQVTPVILTMSARHAVSSLRLQNHRERETSFEVEIYRWTQNDGHDILTPSDAMLAAPSVFAMPAHGEQIVRLARVAARPVGPDEEAYRLILRELPSPEPLVNGSRLQLQFSLPVFISTDDAAPALNARYDRSPDGASVAVVSNSGAGHARLASVENGGTPLADMPRYLLAGSSLSRPAMRASSGLSIAYYPSFAAEPITETFALDSSTFADRGH